MPLELPLNHIPDSNQEYKPSSPNPEKATEQLKQRQEAKDFVGKNLAGDVIWNLQKGEPVNSDQFKHDMLTNPAFRSVILWHLTLSIDNKLSDFIAQSGLNNELSQKYKTEMSEAMDHYKDAGLLPKDAELYSTRVVNQNGRLGFEGNVVSDSEGWKNYLVNYFISPENSLSAGVSVSVNEGVKWRL